MTADESPGAERDASHLGAELRRKLNRAARRGTDIFLAPDQPLRLIGHDSPLAARHLAEIDLGNGKHRVAKDGDVDLASVDVSLDEDLVPPLEHGVDARR